MTFNEWLSSLGSVVTSCVSWISSTINSLKDNYIILTILGLSLFFFLFNLVFHIINYFHSRSTDNLDRNPIRSKYYNDESWKHKIVTSRDISDDLDRYWWEHKHDGR